MGRLFAFAAFAIVGATVAYTAVPASSAARSRAGVARAELAATAEAVVKLGFHAELPPHISTLLGLTREESCAVMQGLLRSAERVEGIDVAEKNHDDVVIFIVDEATSKQTLYLTSPNGLLRRMLVVEKGVGHVAKASKDDVEEFQKEKKMWRERMGVGTGK